MAEARSARVVVGTGVRIAQLAPTYERVPPRGYGGTELVVHLLTEELVRRGHEVTLFATGDSTTSARLVSLVDRAHRYGDSDGIRHPEYVHLANAQACFEAAAAGDFDIVHNHAGIEGLVLGATSETPVLTTCHQAWEPAASEVWRRYPWFHHAVSFASSVTFPRDGQLPPVHHGIDVGSFSHDLRSDGYLLFLGRMSPDKDPATAIQVARGTGRRLVLAGKIDAADRTWAEREVLPLVDADRVRYVGEADGATKRELLARADALLFPIRWIEPFGLVMIEALASGTPVIGFREASVPEIIEDGVTGFVVQDADEMARAVGRLREIDRARCRRAAEERFTVERMTDDYEDRYATAIESTAVTV
jgi:glycosyltransferase involved in cell wall biosynthesis